MAKKRTFISFDYDNDLDLKALLVGQAKNSDSSFEITDMSTDETIDSKWKDNARTRINDCDVVVIICGEKTDTAAGVSAEMKIAQEEEITYFLLNGRADKACVMPKASLKSDRVYNWTWDNLRILMNGGR